MRFKTKSKFLNFSNNSFSKFFYITKKSMTRGVYGRKLILSKGSVRKFKNVNIDSFKNWTKKIYVLINVITIKKKIFGLIKYSNGALSYISITHGFFLGDFNNTTNLPTYLWFFSKPGTTILIFFLKIFSIFNNFSFKCKSKYAKSSGTFCQIIEIYDDFNLILIKLPSGVQKIVSFFNFVTIGRCSNIDNFKIFLGKAGSLKNRGLKSKVRGVAKNPVDHPHGGRTKTNKPEVSPWGWVAKKNK